MVWLFVSTICATLRLASQEYLPSPVAGATIGYIQIRDPILALSCPFLANHRKLTSPNPRSDVWNNQEEETIAPGVLKAFENCSSAIQLDNGWAILTVKPMRVSQKQRPGKRLSWIKFRDEKIELLTARLQESPLYDILGLTDEDCAIQVDSTYCSTDRTRHSLKFRAFCIFPRRMATNYLFLAPIDCILS
jgi:hypothetical protein